MLSRRVLRSRAEARREEDGAAAVEFALVLIPFLVIVFGLIQYGFYFYAAQAGSSAANSALRQLTVGNCQDQVKLQTYVNSRIQGSSGGSATVTRTYYDTTGTLVGGANPAQTVPIGGTVKLVVQFNAHKLNLPFVSFLSQGTVRREVQARVEDTVDEGCGV